MSKITMNDPAASTDFISKIYGPMTVYSLPVTYSSVIATAVTLAFDHKISKARFESSSVVGRLYYPFSTQRKRPAIGYSFLARLV